MPIRLSNMKLFYVFANTIEAIQLALVLLNRFGGYRTSHSLPDGNELHVHPSEHVDPIRHGSHRFLVTIY